MRGKGAEEEFDYEPALPLTQTGRNIASWGKGALSDKSRNRTQYRELERRTRGVV